jgi:MinD-like ATPase involved in chromosome partitioning or flagellar assembly
VRRISVLNFKGGVGKSSLVMNLQAENVSMIASGKQCIYLLNSRSG